MSGNWPWSGLFAVTVWGGAFVATKYALATESLGGFTPAGLVAARFWIGGVALALALAARRERVLPERTDRARVGLLGALLGAHIGLQTYGLVHTYATHAAWIVCFTSVTIAIGAQLFLRQRLTAVGWLGVALAMLGVLGVTRPDANSAEVGFGNLLQFSGCFTWAAYTLLGARAVRSSGALRVTTWNTLIAAALLSLYAFWSGFGHDLGGAQIAALLYLGLVSSAAAFLAWYHSQNVHGSQRTAATLYVEPFVTVLVSAWALGEPLVASTLVGGLVVLPGVWLVQRGSQPTKASA